MRAVLADMALETEAIVALLFALTRSFDEASGDASAASDARILTPSAKNSVQTAPAFLYEAMESPGGNSYVEELPLARAYREAPVNAIWQGSGNIVALDVLRAAAADPNDMESLLGRLATAAATVFDLAPLAARLAHPLKDSSSQSHARFICETLPLLAALSALVHVRLS